MASQLFYIYLNISSPSYHHHIYNVLSSLKIKSYIIGISGTNFQRGKQQISNYVYENTQTESEKERRFYILTKTQNIS